MNIKEKFDKFVDDWRLKKEIKLAKKENDGKQKFNIEKLKDFGLIIVAVMLVGIGYVNFSISQDEEETTQTASQSENNFGDVQLVSSENNLVEEDSQVDETDDESEDAVQTSEDLVENDESDLSEYFTELKLERDNLYSQKLEAYEQIVASDTISSEQKSIAIQEIEEITEMQNEIAIAEELIKLKGFENVVIYVNDDSVSVIVRSAALSTEQIAQIQNIVSRELDVEISDISISNK